MLLVFEAYTVADPGAVVVHADYAAIALGTVVGPWGFHALAFLAEF